MNCIVSRPRLGQIQIMWRERESNIGLPACETRTLFDHASFYEGEGRRGSRYYGIRPNLPRYFGKMNSFGAVLRYSNSTRYAGFGDIFLYRSSQCRSQYKRNTRKSYYVYTEELKASFYPEIESREV